MLLNSLPIMENKFVCGFPYRQRQPYLAVHRYKDTGNGIVPEDIERIFERFYQSKRASNIPFMDKAAQESDYSYVRNHFSARRQHLCRKQSQARSFLQNTITFGKGIPQAESEKEKYEQNEHPLSIPANGNEKRKPSSLLKIMQICVLIFVPFSKQLSIKRSTERCRSSLLDSKRND